ncbi:MAG: FAD-dependent oxidoreductase, partial [Streptosporangiaceae bacterium]
DAAGVFGVQTLDDGAALLADLDRAQPRRAVVVGGGYIGVEMAEALVRRGLAVTVVDQAAQPMTMLDPDMGAAVHQAMEGIGIDVRTDTAVTGFGDGAVESHDGRGDHSPGPRVRPAVLAGMGSDPRGGTAGRHGSAPDRSRKESVTRHPGTVVARPMRAGEDMGALYAYRDKTPSVGAGTVLFDSAEITGDVVIGEGSLIGAG